jgi:hypothetical protein
MGTIGWAGDRFSRPYMTELAPREIVECVERHLTADRVVRRLRPDSMSRA